MDLRLPKIIQRKLGQFERGRKLLLAARGAAEAMLVFCCGLMIVGLIEWALKPRFPARATLSGLNYIATAAFIVWRVWLPLAQRRPLRKVAWNFETAARSHFRERIVSAVELSESASEAQPGISSWMRERTVALAAEEISVSNPAALLDRASSRQAWKRAAAAVSLFGLLCVVPGVAPRAWLALNPYASPAALSRIQFAVQPGNCRLKQGAPLEIIARGPNLPDEVKASIKWDDGFQESVAMSRSRTNEFTLALAAVSQGFRYSVLAGDAESIVFSVKVDVPPRLAHLQLLIEPPAYTGVTNRVVEGGSADFLAGSRVRLEVEAADEKVSAAEWLADIPQVRQLKAEGNRLTLELVPTNQISYQLRLTGENKLQALSAQKWSLRPVADEPPSATLSLAGSEPGLVQPDEILPLQVFAADDVGLRKVDLLVLTGDAETAVKPIYARKNQPANRELRQAFNYNLAELNGATGDELQLQIVATDLRDQTTRSEPLSFTIGSADKAFEARLATRMRRLASDLMAQAEDLQQTRASWLSIARNYRELDPNSQRPALTVLQSRLNAFGAEIEAVGRRLADESETNNPPEARFMYRLGSTISAWGKQQSELLLVNCGRIDQVTGPNLYETFNLDRELFSRALLKLDQYRKVVSVLAGVFETDVLATRCAGAQGRYQRGLPVLRGENVIAPLGKSGAGLLASFFEGVDLRGKLLEQKVDNPRVDNDAPGGRREQWSARYEGDINISQEGEWTLACVADDGVRLTVEGKSLLPAEAWANHPATQYQGELKLAAGWHPLMIEYFQGSSEAKLQLLAGKKGQPPQEVPVESLRPPSAREPKAGIATNAILSAAAKEALKDRIKNSLVTPSSAPPAVAPMTNDVSSENLARLVRQEFPAGISLASNLTRFASWTADDSHKAEAQADELTAFSREAQRILREELEKHRWRYEGAAALKQVQNAIQELREINQELRQQPHNNHKTRTEQEQAKIDLAKAWQKELQRANAEAAHRLFETAKQKEATLAERVTALNATTKIEQELEPAAAKLGATLEENHSKDEMAGQVEKRLNELSDHSRELNDMQEKINREQVAADAHEAFPAARNFDRAQRAQAGTVPERYTEMRKGVGQVLRSQRIAGEYQEAERLQNLAGETPERARGRETAQLIRELANRTDRNVASLAQAIPPPMRAETQSLEQRKDTPPQAANNLAKPRLGMALESARLAQQGDRKTAVAYGLLGQDLGELVDSPDRLSAPALGPLADRAAALAGEKGEDARQAEIRAANERAKQLADNSPDNGETLARRLAEMSDLAKQAAGEAPKRAPLNSQLDDTSKLAAPVPNWSESMDTREIAASAAHDAADEIQAAPNQWESYNDASQTLADAARQLQMNQAVSDLAELNPYAAPPSAAESLTQAAPGSSEQKGDVEGDAGRAITQPPPKGIDQAEWARLNERLRQGIRSRGIENFTEEHQAAIRAYFERLSADAQKPESK